MSPVETVSAYIQGTHGSLPEPDYAAVSALLADDLLLESEDQSHSKDELIGIFRGWGSIVKGFCSVRIHAVVQTPASDASPGGGSMVLAHWETDYDVKDGSLWYATDVDISGKQVRAFKVFARFDLDAAGKIRRIVQRSDTVVKTLGIEQEVADSRKRLAATAGQSHDAGDS